MGIAVDAFTGLILVGLAGAVAQLMDGSLGMGYGVTSATLLATIGFSPAVASATIHVAKIGTGLHRASHTGASGTSTGVLC